MTRLAGLELFRAPRGGWLAFVILLCLDITLRVEFAAVSREDTYSMIYRAQGGAFQGYA